MSQSPATVQILLSTYNGARYLDAQLESIAGQESSDWSLLVRDDGSADSTVEILERWVARLPGRIHWVDAKVNPNLGALRGFSRLLAHSTAPYVMFADQDDVWLSGKVRSTLDAMRREEQRIAQPRPILVHTDLMVVDRDDRLLSNSLWRRQGVAQVRDPGLSRVMVENCAWGCTMMLNRPLVSLVGDVPPAAVYHDWWIALVASAFGCVLPLPKPSVRYRRHGRNESGISNIREVSAAGLTNWRAARDRLADILIEGRPRVAAFLARYRERMTERQIAAAEAFLRLPERGWLARRRDILHHGLVFSGLPRTLGLLLLA